MAKTHTPGPWQMHNEDYCPEEIHGNIDFVDGTGIRGTLICRIEGDMDEPENWANAQLIMAAPDLLLSLMEMVTNLISHASFGLNEEEVAMLSRAEKAIAKAGAK